MNIDFDENDCTLLFELERDGEIVHRGVHKTISYEIKNRGFIPEELRGMAFLQPSTWCTYIILSDVEHERYKKILQSAPWNGEITCYEHYLFSACYSYEEPGEPIYHEYRVGDDFNHHWDLERYKEFNLEYMRNHIKSVIDYIIEKYNEQ